MNDRPKRKLQHLKAKIDDKVSRTNNKAGKRAKRWKKFAETYTPIAGE